MNLKMAALKVGLIIAGLAVGKVLAGALKSAGVKIVA